VCVCVCVCCCRACVQLQQDTTPHDETRTCRLLAAMMCLFSFLSFSTSSSSSFFTGCLLQVRGKFMPSHEFIPRKRSLHLAHHCKQSHLRWCADCLCVHVAVHVAHQSTTCTKATHRMMHGTTTSYMPPGMDDGLIWSCDPWTRHSCQVSWCNTLLPIGPVFVWSDDDALCPVPAHRSCYAWFTSARPGMSWHLHKTQPNLTLLHPMNLYAGFG
jgi:hypothetical protein